MRGYGGYTLFSQWEVFHGKFGSLSPKKATQLAATAPLPILKILTFGGIVQICCAQGNTVFCCRGFLHVRSPAQDLGVHVTRRSRHSAHHPQVEEGLAGCCQTRIQTCNLNPLNSESSVLTT